MDSNQKSNITIEDVLVGGVNLNDKQLVDNRLILIERQVDQLFGFVKGLMEINQTQVRLINNLQRILDVTEIDLTF